MTVIIPLEFERYYHVFNHANGWEKIFYSPENFRFFLQQYRKYLLPYVDTYCYCLMSNHFHLLIQVKSKQEIVAHLSKDNDLKNREKNLKKLEATPDEFISKQFSKLFSSYTQALNKQTGRMGSLFMKGFKRKPIEDEKYLKKLVHYIHHNPVEAGLCGKPGDWLHSSYRSIIGREAQWIKCDEVINWFSGIEDFAEFHRLGPQLTDV